MAISVALTERAKSITGTEQWPFRAVAAALEVVPRTLAQNCGADTVRLMTQLRAAKQGEALPALGVGQPAASWCSRIQHHDGITRASPSSDASGGASPYLGIDGNRGVLADMVALGVLDPFAVRTQVIKSAVEAAAMLLRIDDILSGMKSKNGGGGESRQPAEEGEGGGGPMDD